MKTGRKPRFMKSRRNKRKARGGEKLERALDKFFNVHEGDRVVFFVDDKLPRESITKEPQGHGIMLYGYGKDLFNVQYGLVVKKYDDALTGVKIDILVHPDSSVGMYTLNSEFHQKMVFRIKPFYKEKDKET